VRNAEALNFSLQFSFLRLFFLSSLLTNDIASINLLHRLHPLQKALLQAIIEQG
jgi:hypothetical protein